MVHFYQSDGDNIVWQRSFDDPNLSESLEDLNGVGFTKQQAQAVAKALNYACAVGRIETKRFLKSRIQDLFV